MYFPNRWWEPLRWHCLLCLLCIAWSSTCWAQEDSATVVARETPTLWQTLGADAVAIGNDACAYGAAPFSWSAREWLYTAGIVGGSVLVMAADEDIAAWMRRQETPTRDDISAVVKLYGEKTYAALFCLSLYTAGYVVGSDDVRITGRLVGESLLLAGITTQIVKMVAGRSRPFRGEGAWFFAPLQTDNGRMSLSSGHTAVAFAVSSVLAERIGNVWASVGLYSLASMTALSRVYDGEHWLSDAVVGAAIGTSAGIAVTTWEKQRNTGQQAQVDTHTLVVFPTLNGIACMYRW